MASQSVAQRSSAARSSPSRCHRDRAIFPVHWRPLLRITPISMVGRRSIRRLLSHEGPTMSTQQQAARSAFQALLSGQAPNGATPEAIGDWWSVYSQLCAAYETGGTSAVRQVWGALARANHQLTALIAAEAPAHVP